MDLTEHSFDRLPGVSDIWKLIVAQMQEWNFDETHPPSGLTILGSADLALEGKLVNIDYVKYNISRRYEFPMFDVRPIQGCLVSVRISDETSRIKYTDKEHVLFLWKPTTQDMAREKGMGWSMYYETLLRIWYS